METRRKVSVILEELTKQKHDLVVKIIQIGQSSALKLLKHRHKEFWNQSFL
jgi:hypothetical protein